MINLDRRPDRWAEIQRELGCVVDVSDAELTESTVRFAAIDARDIAELSSNEAEVDSFYSLRDQLFVEPQPRALPDRIELDRPIQMTLPEVAVALSHIGVWRQIAANSHEYALILEDDIWFRRGFARQLELAWEELHEEQSEQFDVLYLSYKEVKHGAQKTFLSEHVFRPFRGLWYLSGYVLSRSGARKLLQQLPCRGPVDLWINHQFESLAVRATRQSLVAQRLDGESTNSYSILPVLSRIGLIDSGGASLFQIRPAEGPVFVFGPEASGLSSVAMALSVLGYRCCSDLEKLPEQEHARLLSGSAKRVFNAYVNIGSLAGRAQELRQIYPRAKFIYTTNSKSTVNEDVDRGQLGSSGAELHSNETSKWRIICEHLKCAPPVFSFPQINDLGQRRVLNSKLVSNRVAGKKRPKRDQSPWVVGPRHRWEGIRTESKELVGSEMEAHVGFSDSPDSLDSGRWVFRDDTFPGNMALFRPRNVDCHAKGGVTLTVEKETFGVRSFSAAAISSCSRYRYGRFEAVIQPSNVPGVVTGFFLHRDSPRQEIDVEIAGNRPSRLLANVFYNPGDEGARMDYGYRGAPSYIDLGFDASMAAHRFAIEWEPDEIRWLVDGRVVHSRINWDPTPIPTFQ
ncbi:MAG: family 16 glycosylhydrolase [Deltaproteobacteria bacterium]|nr:family 16 glycosylhydrolase [Deltaproteobacteria bacterium]